MYLTVKEHEAFIRGKAAGLIPVAYPLPMNKQSIDDLIFHIGVMFSTKVGYRRWNKTLGVMELTAFSREFLDRLVPQLPVIKRDKVYCLTQFRRNSEPNMLEGLYNYFSFGSSIVDEGDLQSRLAVDDVPLSKNQILKAITNNIKGNLNHENY